MVSEKVIRSLQLANPWWAGNSIPPQYQLPYERKQLKSIIAYEKLRRIVVIKGPRRTGKTTLMYQYIAKLLEKGVVPQRILFASMDDLNLRIALQDLIDTYQIALNLQEKSADKLYLFLDEIHFLENWSLMAKTITDRDKSIYLVVSGSSASLMAKSSESLAGRTIEETILPFTFREAIEAQVTSSPKLLNWLREQSSPNLAQLHFNPSALLYQIPLQQQLRLFLERGGFPHLFEVEDKSLWLELLRTDLVQKVIYKDLTELYGIRDPLTLEKLFLYLVEATGGIANLSSISTQLQLARETLSQYINFLANAYLIFPLPKYSRYPKEILKSQQKLHILDPALASLVGGVGVEKLLESVVASHLLHQKGIRLYYWRQNYEVDCVVEKDAELIPIEIKESKRPFQASDYRGLLNFMEKYQTKLGIIIYQGEPNEIKIEKGVIRLLPAWYALTQL